MSVLGPFFKCPGPPTRPRSARPRLPLEARTARQVDDPSRHADADADSDLKTDVRRRSSSILEDHGIEYWPRRWSRISIPRRTRRAPRRTAGRCPTTSSWGSRCTAPPRSSSTRPRRRRMDPGRPGDLRHEVPRRATPSVTSPARRCPVPAASPKAKRPPSPMCSSPNSTAAPEPAVRRRVGVLRRVGRRSRGAHRRQLPLLRPTGREVHAPSAALTEEKRQWGATRRDRWFGKKVRPARSRRRVSSRDARDVLVGVGDEPAFQEFDQHERIAEGIGDDGEPRRRECRRAGS